MLSNSDRPQRRRLTPSPLLLAATSAAIACAALALFISTESWVNWFAHPGQPNVDLTRQGAALWRIMLGVSAAMLAAMPVIWMALSRGEENRHVKRALSRPPRRIFDKRRLWGLAAIVLLAVACRAARIHESLWYDEIASWMTYTGGVGTIGAVIGNFLDPINHPFHTLLNHLSVQWFSDRLGVEIAFRLPALIFSILSVLAMYGLARAVFEERVAMIAALLAAVLPVSVLEAVEARGYSMMICFAAMMTWILIAARSPSQSRNHRPWLWLAYTIAAALGVWSHFVTAFVPIGHGVWMMWRAGRHWEWRESINGFAALGLAAAMTITLYSPMIPAMLDKRGMFAAVSIDQPTIVGAEGFHALLQLGGSWSWWAALPGLSLGVIGFIAVVRWGRECASGRDSSMRWIELAMIGLPLMVIVIALSGTWMYARFTLFALPGAILLMAMGIDSLRRWRRLAGWIAMAMVVLSSAADLAMRPAKQPLRDAADHVRSHRNADDRLLVIGLAHPVLRIYAQDLKLAYTFKHGANLAPIMSSTRPEWIVVEYPNSVRPETYKLLELTGYVPDQRFHGWVDWTNGDVMVYRPH